MYFRISGLPQLKQLALISRPKEFKYEHAGRKLLDTHRHRHGQLEVMNGNNMEVEQVRDLATEKRGEEEEGEKELCGLGSYLLGMEKKTYELARVGTVGNTSNSYKKLEFEGNKWGLVPFQWGFKVPPNPPSVHPLQFHMIRFIDLFREVCGFITTSGGAYRSLRVRFGTTWGGSSFVGSEVPERLMPHCSALAGSRFSSKEHGEVLHSRELLPPLELVDFIGVESATALPMERKEESLISISPTRCLL
ncbi:hypothetical protein FXO37_34747 [Capsicum annuum]|nr:hypothetical protein FXO37_34747 [Capsicum annuum]